MWRIYRLSELTFALGTLANASNYDLFVWDNAGTLTLSAGPAWTSDTARGSGAGTTELEVVDGVVVNKVAISGGPGARAGRVVGGFRTTATTTTEDSKLKRFLWNAQLRSPRPFLVFDTADSWSYTTDTWRQANANTANKVEWLCGLVADPMELRVDATVNLNVNSARAAKVGVGINSITSPISTLQMGGYFNGTSSLNTYVGAAYRDVPALGYSYGAWLEKGADGGCTFDGDDGGDGRQGGMSGFIWA
jgi:hypothetical protein